MDEEPAHDRSPELGEEDEKTATTRHMLQEGEEEAEDVGASTATPFNLSTYSLDKSTLKLARELSRPFIVQCTHTKRRRGRPWGRSQVFEDYLDFCARTGYLPTNNAALGRLFKRAFPNVSCRRLGKRGENKMHYANICKRDIKAEQSASLAASLSQWQEATKEEHAEQKQAKEPHSTKEDGYGVVISANTVDSSVSTSNTGPSSTVLNTSRCYNSRGNEQ